MVVKVKLSDDPERTVTIPITKTNQGGASNSDYGGAPADLTFNSGDTEQSFTFTATEDDLDDDDESVKLTFGTLPAGVSPGSTAETTVSITDDDVPGVTASFEKSSYNVAEGGTVEVKVTLSDDPERTVTIPITKANQGGASNSDYSGVPASVEFNSGDTEQSFTFTATEDDLDDDDESVKLGFGTLPTGVSAGSIDGGDGIDHRRRRSVRGSRLRAGSIHGRRGGGRGSEGDPERRPRADGHHPDHEGQPGRGVQLRLLRRARRPYLQ